MKFVAPDTCLKDYEARRAEFVKSLPTDSPKKRFAELKKWTDANSPYSPSEKLGNLMRALFGSN
jgi:hypothetical protein